MAPDYMCLMSKIGLLLSLILQFCLILLPKEMQTLSVNITYAISVDEPTV